MRRLVNNKKKSIKKQIGSLHECVADICMQKIQFIEFNNYYFSQWHLILVFSLNFLLSNYSKIVPIIAISHRSLTNLYSFMVYLCRLCTLISPLTILYTILFLYCSIQISLVEKKLLPIYKTVTQTILRI